MQAAKKLPAFDQSSLSGKYIIKYITLIKNCLNNIFYIVARLFQYIGGYRNTFLDLLHHGISYQLFYLMLAVSYIFVLYKYI